MRRALEHAKTTVLPNGNDWVRKLHTCFTILKVRFMSVSLFLHVSDNPCVHMCGFDNYIIYNLVKLVCIVAKPHGSHLKVQTPFPLPPRYLVDYNGT